MIDKNGENIQREKRQQPHTIHTTIFFFWQFSTSILCATVHNFRYSCGKSIIYNCGKIEIEGINWIKLGFIFQLKLMEELTVFEPIQWEITVRLTLAFTAHVKTKKFDGDAKASWAKCVGVFS